MNTEAIRRVALVFSLLDTNGNGVLEAEDFELMADGVVGVAPASDRASQEAMRAAFRRYWTTLRTELDADGDGEITFEEYVACVLSPERFDATIGVFAEALAALGDPDGDGQIERPLFVALMTAIGFEPTNIDTLFDAFGPSDQDRIQVATWVEGIKDYYAPDKAGIPGDHLVVNTAV
ncbi:EF hand [Streptomyces sp. ADI96-02]|uniref:EF-hand domain-containing protein n=1 Tax=unclassified Streptomyces TaxID=2593676 RepID=UPI000F558D16|nr:EF-hand domain-containing protein [Streptomyces sp. ADI96-02]RPK68504.1 EF hand [Streptomyces sp. ADI96-02]